LIKYDFLPSHVWIFFLSLAQWSCDKQNQMIKKSSYYEQDEMMKKKHRQNQLVVDDWNMLFVLLLICSCAMFALSFSTSLSSRNLWSDLISFLLCIFDWNKLSELWMWVGQKWLISAANWYLQFMVECGELDD
jgi:hypothetical protein